MFEPILNIFRRRALRKWQSDVKTSLMPLSSVKSVAILMDVQDPGFQDYQEQILSWFKARGLRPEVHFFDFRRLEKGELLITSIQNTLLKKDLNWYGMPAPAHVTEIADDMFISLVDNDDFPTRFYAACTRCRYKVGRRSWPGHPFDLVVSGPEGSSGLDVFNEMKIYLEKIN